SGDTVPSLIVELYPGLQIQLRCQYPAKRIADLINTVPAKVVVLSATAAEGADDIHRDGLSQGGRVAVGFDHLKPQFIHHLPIRDRQLAELDLPVSAGRIETALGQVQSTGSLILCIGREVHQVVIERVVSGQPQLTSRADRAARCRAQDALIDSLSTWQD